MFYMTYGSDQRRCKKKDDEKKENSSSKITKENITMKRTLKNKSY